ncbi:MAG: helix-turn-helix domain-containing protein [Bacteroidia bacterium]
MTNPEFEFAEQFALHTEQHIFLTGKAGSGKTTLLKHIADKTTKNFVIVAPTGVAAINAGGTTIHSMFYFPTTSFIPSNEFVNMNLVTNRSLLLKRMRYNREKRRLLQELELLIIDEVSMVRCDILDAIDFVLQVVRRNKLPFGGVQVLLIGDMHQLPPVTKDNEWEILKRYYQSPYFFDSQVWQKLDAVQIELKKIYRQSDERFLNLLNNIRNKEMEQEDFEQLEKRFQPLFKPTEKGYVMLCTHNNKADAINSDELRKLPAKMHSFEAEIEGEFPENMYPCERILNLKEGAQVMFIKNDTDSGKYYNGKLAVIKKIAADEIIVEFNENKESHSLERQAWENTRYTVEEGSGKISKNDLGMFRQYPLRLAWAITIHKSQGLTFDKVIIDAGQSFAAGQVYVALSRCRSLEGIVLHSRITQNALFTDDKINLFSTSHHNANKLQEVLSEAKIRYAKFQLKRLFTFSNLSDRTDEWKEMIEQKEIPEKEKAIELCEKIKSEIILISETADKFQAQLDRLLNNLEESVLGNQVLKERCGKAIDYFTSNLYNQMITPLHEHVQSLAYKSRVKKYVQHVQMLEENFWNKIDRLYNANFSDEKLFAGEIKFSKASLKKIASSVTSGKKEKGGTYNDTLELYKQGKTIEEIATIRSLTAGTIKGHFAKWILAGEINIMDVLSAEKVSSVENAIDKYGADNYGGLKSALGDAFDYSEVRMVINAMSLKAKSI